ncbi:hypothetical protein ACHAQJ_004306 [Trichoderma viride]
MSDNADHCQMCHLLFGVIVRLLTPAERLTPLSQERLQDLVRSVGLTHTIYDPSDPSALDTDELEEDLMDLD